MFKGYLDHGWRYEGRGCPEATAIDHEHRGKASYRNIVRGDKIRAATNPGARNDRACTIDWCDAYQSILDDIYDKDMAIVFKRQIDWANERQPLANTGLGDNGTVTAIRLNSYQGATAGIGDD